MNKNAYYKLIDILFQYMNRITVLISKTFSIFNLILWGGYN